MQAPMTQPHAAAIPDKQLETVAPTVGKRIGTAITGTATQRVLDPHRQTIDAGTHVDRLDHQPDLRRCRDHGSCLSNSDSQETLLPGNSIRQPLGLCSSTMLLVAGIPTLTGTRVKDELAAPIASFSLRHQR